MLSVYTLIKLIWEPAGSEQNITSIKLQLLLFVFISTIQVAQNRLGYWHTEKGVVMAVDYMNEWHERATETGTG